MAELLVVGLGNPGPEYRGTRHNVGFDVLDLLASRHGASLKKSREHATLGDCSIAGHRVALACPLTFMNESGRAVAPLVRRYGLGEELWRVVIVHDELDLPLGRLKVKSGGGLAGNNGLRSIKAHLHSDSFTRVRIGIGRPPGGKEGGADHVLSRPGKTERTELEIVVQEAADAVEAIATDGLAATMTRFNTRD